MYILNFVLVNYKINYRNMSKFRLDERSPEIRYVDR
jgi:hypothetical protein